jgi:uncharacterized protein (DUF1778 family)
VSKKMGRPTSDPKDIRIGLRLTQRQDEMLRECMEKLGKTRTEILMMGLEKVYKNLK